MGNETDSSASGSGDGSDGGMGTRVVRLRDGQVEWRMGDLAHRMRGEDALELALEALAAIDWEIGRQLGVRVEGGAMAVGDTRAQLDHLERLRANGVVGAAAVHRPVAVGPWSSEQERLAPNGRAKPKVRQYTKEAAVPPEERPGARAGARPKPMTRQRGAALVEDDPVITKKLFAEEETQLRYEVRHWYLMTVPLSQREQYVMHEYELLPSFLKDIEQQGAHVGRGQIIAAVVDVVSGRARDINSRMPRPLRKTDGKETSPIITRSSDGAVAWRANVSHGTPAARRIMWWARPDHVIELARFATHDDVSMPEK